MREYIDKLYQEMREIAGKSVTLGRTEEIKTYADTICALKHLHKTEHASEEFDREAAMHWMEHMENADGSTGPHWTMDQTTAVADSLGIREIRPWAWGVAMNMMYSDYYPVAVEFGLNRPDFYAALAKAFLLDKDGPGAEEKLLRYYTHVVR